MAEETRSSLGKALSRLFSSNIVVRNLGGNQLKMVDPSNIQSVASKYYESKYKGLHSYNQRGRAHQQHQQAPGSNIGYLSERTGLYRDYETMDTDAIISAALDMYADEAVAENEYGDVLTIDAEDQEVKDILHNLFYEILDVEFNMRWWVRTLAKYGDCYLKLSISEEYGVVSAEPMSPFEVERMEGTDEDDPYSVTFKHTGFSDQPEYEFWQVAHFRLLSDGNYLPYGKSILEGARRTWKQLCLHEETRIWMENGYKEIRNVESGDTVYSFDPDSGETIKTEVKSCEQMADQDTYTVSTRHRQVRATDRHGFLVYSEENGFNYKPVEELDEDEDHLVLPVTENNKDEYTVAIDKEYYSVGLSETAEYESSGIMERIQNLDTIRDDRGIHLFIRNTEEVTRKIPYQDFEKVGEMIDIDDDKVDVYYKNSKNKRIVDEDFEFTVDSEFAQFFGFMLGDGWLNENGIGFCLGNEDISRKYLDYISDEFNFNYHVYGDEGNRLVKIYSGELRHIFENLGFISGFENKVVPEWVFGMSPKFKRKFIEGIFDADGSWGEYDAGRLGLSNFELIEGVHVLAQQCNIGTGRFGFESEFDHEEVTEWDSNFDKEVNRQKAYRAYLNFEDNYSDKFELQKVKSVEFFEEESKTYDLEVDHELHNFVADGVVSHNTLLEDAMLVHRVMRAPEKRIFRIDVGNIEPDAVDTFMDQIVQEINKTPLIDPETGEYNLKYNMMNMIEDYYLPVRGGESGTEIDTLSGLEYQAIEDVEYLRKKMMTALRIPNAFLGYEEELEGKATLAQQSIKFARQVKYIQKIVVSELKKVAMIHLFSLGIRDQRLVEFDLSLTTPSTVQESEYLDLLSQKIDLARTITELPIFSTQWIYKTFFSLSDEEIQRQRELKKDDWKRQFQQDQITREGNDPVKTGQSFGTPHDLSQSGSANVKPISLEKDRDKQRKNKAVKNMQKSKQNKTGGDPLGQEKAFDPANISGDEPDYEQRYRDRRGLPVDHFMPGKKKDLIKESLKSIDEDSVENFFEDSDFNGGQTDEFTENDLEEIEEGTFMDEQVLEF